ALVWLISSLAQALTGKKQPTAGGKLSVEHRDVAVIAAVMKQLGVEGILTIRQVQ
ncbi:MAG: hypothetical protein GX228_08285, partial [Firmicutes bacterium]|nr:hypothetical protein [Bacillota bacterium]